MVADDLAFNYDSLANLDDESCEYTHTAQMLKTILKYMMTVRACWM